MVDLQIKKYFLLLLILFSIVRLAALDAHDSTSLVLQRFYIIHRLEKICTLCFFSEEESHHELQKLQPILPLLQHPFIRESLQLAIKEDTIVPLKQIWSLVNTYHFLGDNFFVEEFLRIIYILLHKSLEFSDIQNSYKIQHAVDDHAIVYRFYSIERLKHAVNYCKSNKIKNPATKVMLAWWNDYKEYKNIDQETFSFGICSLLIKLLAPGKVYNFTNYTLEDFFQQIDSITDLLSPKVKHA